MTLHLLKYSLRALRRQRGYVAINVIGLAIGMACSLMIGLFILNELSYDQYHKDKDRIFRVGLHAFFAGQEIKGAYTSSPIGPVMTSEFPEVASFLRMDTWDETTIQIDDRFFSENYFVLADSTFFDFFSIPMISGNPQTALVEPFSVVLSESSANRLFPDEDPMDKMLRIGGAQTLFRVTGVMQDVPENTHFYANMVGSFSTNPRSVDNNWLSNSFFTYLKLHPGAKASDVSDRFEGLIIKHIGPMIKQLMGITIEDFVSHGNSFNYFLQPLTRLRLDPSVEFHQKPPTDPKYIWIFSAIGILILVIASVNFMNLSTAQATKRAKEVGMKKVAGSTRGMLIGQFVAETVILSLFALLLAFGIARLALPAFNQWIGLGLSFSFSSVGYAIPAMILLALIVGLLAGSYPAFYLSSFNPISVLKGKGGNGKQNTLLRKGLTVLQFAISIMLISSSVIMYRQLNFMLEKDLGFNKENLLVIRRAQDIGNQVNSFKSELLGVPGVISVSASTAVPGRSNNTNGYSIRGRDDETFLLQTTWADYDFLKTYNIKIAEGRFFDPDMLTDQQACVINERTLRNFRIDDAMGTRFVAPGENMQVLPVIGVMQDYHFESLRFDITPCIILFKNENMNWGYISIRIERDKMQQVLNETESLWSEFASGNPMMYFFMDDDFNRLYAEEKQNAGLSLVFTLLAIFIASMGLYGLTAFTLQQRIREIGIRRTFGASVPSIWYIFSKDVMILIGIACAIGWPLVYWIAGNWLQKYHYRIGMHPADFLAGLLVASLIALATISYRVIRTASINPSLSLRYE